MIQAERIITVVGIVNTYLKRSNEVSRAYYADLSTLFKDGMLDKLKPWYICSKTVTINLRK